MFRIDISLKKIAHLIVLNVNQLHNYGLLWKRYVITSRIVRSLSWLGQLLHNACVTDDHGYASVCGIQIMSYPQSCKTYHQISSTMCSTIEAEIAYTSGFLGSCWSIFSVLCTCVDHCLSFVLRLTASDTPAMSFPFTQDRMVQQIYCQLEKYLWRLKQNNHNTTRLLRSYGR